MDWIKDRIAERTTWDGVSMMVIGCIILFASPWVQYAAYAAIGWGFWTMVTNVAFVGLVVVLAQTYYAVKSLEDKVRTLFELVNKLNDRDR
jgi:hypothetical protein